MYSDPYFRLIITCHARFHFNLMAKPLALSLERKQQQQKKKKKKKKKKSWSGPDPIDPTVCAGPDCWYYPFSDSARDLRVVWTYFLCVKVAHSLGINNMHTSAATKVLRSFLTHNVSAVSREGTIGLLPHSFPVTLCAVGQQSWQQFKNRICKAAWIGLYGDMFCTCCWKNYAEMATATGFPV